jgi:SAM-dependent methyltransferase
VKPEEIVAQSRGVFDVELHDDQSKQILRDEVHRQSLLQLADIRPGKRYLDLGTGSGYLAFGMAEQFPDILVTGLDVAENSLKTNRRIQQERGVKNVDFCSYDGMHLPFGDSRYFGVLCRYAFHHFPKPVLAVRELHRVVESRGFVLISDPITFDEDTVDYIDRFQRLRPDGHVHFLRRGELDALFQDHGFCKESEFTSAVSYPREMDEHYKSLLDTTPPGLLSRYKVNLQGNAVFSTLEVANVLFRKAG